jgi:hypothetical protein
MSVVDVGERVQDTLFQLVHDTKLDPLIGLHLSSVLRGALCAKRRRRVAYRASREGPRDIVVVPKRGSGARSE